MNIESLKYFLCIEKYNNFSLAAEELCISQSSLSKHIKNLENELNCILFKRNTRNIEITQEGILLKKYALSITNNYNELLTKINEFSFNSRISIGYIPVINQYNIASNIGLFKDSTKDLEFEFHEGEHEDILTLLLNRDIDFAIIRSDTLDSNKLNVFPLAKDELVLTVSKHHPLANKKYITIKELANENFISLGKNSGVYNIFLEKCKEESFEPRIICFNSRIENILGLVSAGLGISPLMKKTIECFDNSNFSTILFKEKIPSSLCLVHLKNKKLNNLENEFKNYLINAFEKN